jgi:hypothetical protein
MLWVIVFETKYPRMDDSVLMTAIPISTSMQVAAIKQTAIMISIFTPS